MRWLMLTALLTAGCVGDGDARPSPPLHGGVASAQTPAPVVNDARFQQAIRLAVRAHERWGRVDDRARFAPFDCRLPPPPTAHFSRSGDSATHGEKLYSVFAMDPVAYGFPRHVFPPSEADEALRALGVTQALVKDAYAAMREPASDAPPRMLPATRDGVTYHPGPSLGLFLVMRFETTRPGTDEGVIYGTVSPDGAITSAGRVASCMGCHQRESDRVFGLPGHATP